MAQWSRLAASTTDQNHTSHLIRDSIKMLVTATVVFTRKEHFVGDLTESNLNKPVFSQRSGSIKWNTGGGPVKGKSR